MSSSQDILKKKFSLMTKCSHKYLISPLYRGATLWDELDKNVEDKPALKYYTNEILKTQRVYVDLIG